MALITETKTYPIASQVFTIQRDDLNILIQVLEQQGYTVVSPTMGEAAIILDKISSVSDLPVGWADEQDGGVYRLKRRDDNAIFGHGAGPHSWKQLLFTPERNVLTVDKTSEGFSTSVQTGDIPQYAFFGVSPGDLVCDRHPEQSQSSDKSAVVAQAR